MWYRATSLGLLCTPTIQKMLQSGRIAMMTLYMPLRPQTTRARDMLKTAAVEAQPSWTIRGSPCTASRDVSETLNCYGSHHQTNRRTMLVSEEELQGIAVMKSSRVLVSTSEMPRRIDMNSAQSPPLNTPSSHACTSYFMWIAELPRLACSHPRTCGGNREFMLSSGLLRRLQLRYRS